MNLLQIGSGQSCSASVPLLSSAMWKPENLAGMWRRNQTLVMTTMRGCTAMRGCTEMHRFPAMRGCAAMGDYAYAHGFGSVNRTTTFFRLKDGGVGVRCGCFYGTLAQFRDKIRETHGETKKAQEYLMLADLMELRFEEDENEVGNRKYGE